MAYIDRLFVLLILSAYFIVPWIIEWAGLTAVAWYQFYLIWFFAIGLAYWVSRGKDLDDF